MIWYLLFPPKCVLCSRVLEPGQLDLCHACREKAPWAEKRTQRHRFIEAWTAVWYYEGHVRESLLRFKFARKRSYAEGYGRLLALRIAEDLPGGFDVVCWVPVSARRKMKRGFDQGELLARAVSRELELPAAKLLRKVRHTPAQSTMQGESERRANILGAYKAVGSFPLTGKRVLLLDDILTTGSTVQECAKTLLLAGAQSVCCAAVAVRKSDKKQARRTVGG